MSDSFGSWQLDTLIAVGGLGEIWRASRANSADVALKRIHTHLIRNAEACDQFTREQQLAMTLPRHPNVVAGVEADAVEGRSYIALELARGEDLRRTLAPKTVIPRSRAIAIVLAACDAASHLHANGWVHGDINPSNLVIDPQPTGDRVVLIDLGIARQIGEAGAPRGTHAYMAPEQVRGEAWTPATDVFALGVLLWELIAHDRLFHRGPTWLSMRAVIEDEPRPLNDRALDAIARTALAKDPGARIATPALLAERLRAG